MKRTIFIFHGTEGYPEENWFPWLKQQLEVEGHQVFVPQFPTPPIVPAKIDEWFAVFKDYVHHLDKNSIIIGHSLGGIFALRALEALDHPIAAACFIGTPIGVQPIANYERDSSFSGFAFNWETIKAKARDFIVFQSDNDPYVGLENGEQLAANLGVELSFVPGAGHFNKAAGYIEFPALFEKVDAITSNHPEDVLSNR